jgi:ATP-dependent DNA helicase RecQ
MDQKALLHKHLKEYFGYDTFRPLQEKVIQAVLEKKDNLVIMPTGGGKSICYQLPALVLEGVTLVLSPLIALMKDQVDGMNANGIPSAYLNSSQSNSEVETVIQKLTDGKLKLLYLAPESLKTFETLIAELPIQLIAIDEAHCISSWGHDFRPAYTQLSFLKKQWPKVPIIALTATADKATRSDILNQLNLKNAEQHIASFDRPNLSLEVQVAHDRITKIITFIKERPNSSGIVYCLSRKTTEQVANSLQKKGHKAKAYHAGLPAEERSKIQENFVRDKSKIICATIAFGMGIDKSNIRWVIHYNLPKNIEGYYQEIGRAGRDGIAAETLLFYSYADVIQLQKFANNSSNKEVQISKLERMKQYTEALSCRRKVLLNYFGEFVEKDCGNCDVCKNPPTIFDGTLLSQKILSGIARLQQKEPIGTVVDFLRGSQNALIYDKGYQHLKTYGLLKKMAWSDVQQYTIQLLNLGYCELAFDENNAIKLSQLAKKILFENEKVFLTKVLLKPTSKKKSSPKTKHKEIPSLFENLRRLRLEIAQQKNIAAYLVFSDATLKQMELKLPINDADFKKIEGVGRKKFEDYGDAFIKRIVAFQRSTTPSHLKNTVENTFQKTLELHQKGLSALEISTKRKLHLATVQNHLLKLFQEGKEVNLNEFVTQKEVTEIKKAREELKNSKSLRLYFDHFEEQMPYPSLKFGLAILERNTD